MELNSKNIKKIIFLIFCAAFIFICFSNLGAVFAFLGKLIGFFSPVIAALCIAFVLNVLLTALETKLFSFMDKAKKNIVRKLKRPLCLLFTYLIALGLISVLILVIIPDIIETVTYLADRLPSLIVKARDGIENFLNSFNIKQSSLPDIKINWQTAINTLKNWLTGYSKNIFGEAVNITTSVFSGVFDGIFSIVISIYILAQKEKVGCFVKKAINAFIPKKATDVIYHISSCTQELFSRFIGGQLVEACILGSLCFVGMAIFRIPNALIISVLIGVTALVPIIGATIGVVIGFLLIVISSPLKAMLFVVFVIILQQIEGNLIYPRVVGKAVGLPGIIVISAVLVGGNIGGILGSLIAVPTSAVLFTLFKEAIELKTKKASGQFLPQSPQKK